MASVIAWLASPGASYVTGRRSWSTAATAWPKSAA